MEDGRAGQGRGKVGGEGTYFLGEGEERGGEGGKGRGRLAPQT